MERCELNENDIPGAFLQSEPEFCSVLTLKRSHSLTKTIEKDERRTANYTVILHDLHSNITTAPLKFYL